MEPKRISKPALHTRNINDGGQGKKASKHGRHTTGAHHRSISVNKAWLPLYENNDNQSSASKLDTKYLHTIPLHNEDATNSIGGPCDILPVGICDEARERKEPYNAKPGSTTYGATENKCHAGGDNLIECTVQE